MARLLKGRVRLSGLFKASVHLGILASVVVTAAFFFFSRSHPGQRWILDRILPLAESAVNGTIRVGDIRSGTLLDGARLYELTITDPGGAPFLEVDSVTVRYRVLELLVGRMAFSRLELFGPRVRIVRLPGEDRSNVSVLFGPRDADTPGPTGTAADTLSTDTASSSRSERGGRLPRVAFRNVRIVDGSVEVLLPVEGAIPPRIETMDGPGGGTLRRIAAEAVQARLPRLLVSPSGEDQVRGDVESLSLEATIYEDPLLIEQLAGQIRWADGAATVDATEIRLPGSSLSGTVRAELDGPRFALDLDASPLDLADVRWADPRVPEGVANGGLSLVLAPEEVHASFRGLEAEFGADRLRVDGGLSLVGARPRFAGLDVGIEGLGLERIGEWTGAMVPVAGRLNGRLTLDGSSTAIHARSNLTLFPPEADGSETVMEAEGVLRWGTRLDVTGLVATLDPLDFRTVGRALADSLELKGRGRAVVVLDGSLPDSVRFTADVDHGPGDEATSRVVARGSVVQEGGDVRLDIGGQLSPLSFSTLRTEIEGLPISGEVTGSFQLRGALTDLTLDAQLDTEVGRMALAARGNARRPEEGYQIHADVEAFPLDRFVPGLPEPSVVSGDATLAGSGVTAESIRAGGAIRLRRSVIGGIPLDTARLDLRIAEGTVTLDTLQARGVGADLEGGGRMPIKGDGGQGELRLALTSESLEGLRSVIRGDTVIARDTLNGLQMELVAAAGVDVDTLPLLEDVAVGGRVRGNAVIRGSLEDFGAEGVLDVEEFLWGTSYVRAAHVEATATEVAGGEGRIVGRVELDSLDVLDRTFRSGKADVDYAGGRAGVSALLVRSDEEDYRVRGDLALDSAGGSVHLEELELRFDTVTWTLERPGTVTWDPAGILVDELLVSRPGPEAMRIRTAGRLPRRGDADFTFDVDGLPLPRLTRLAQVESIDLRGVADLTLRVTGAARSPVIHGDVQARDVAYASWDLEQLTGSFDYQDRRAAVDVRAWRDDMQVLVATGSVPVDLSLTRVEDRVPDDQAMDLRVIADSLPAAFAVTLLENLEDVEGTVAGDFRIGGTLESPSPTGTLTIQNAAWTVVALGVRQHDIQGRLTLDPDGTMDVDARARSGGSVQVTGKIGLEPLDNPSFDLVLRFDEFEAIDRRDMEGRVSGEVTLGGRFREPMVEGLAPGGRGLTAVGNLYVEEFARSGLIVDLSDPRFRDIVSQDFLNSAQPIIAASRNPFLDALRVNVDVTVGRDTWLRSTSMDVEIDGQLNMAYNREERDLVLRGELQARRGSYTFGRRFNVQQGTVEFVGTPGVNPNLSIEATTRVRRPDGDPLDITATLTGTLADPRVALSSDEGALAQSDILSYLTFGRPSYELTSGQAQGLQDAIGAARGFIGGMFTSRISTLLGQRFGLDYFAINAGADPGASGPTANSTLAQTTVELGSYLGEELFWALTLRPAGLEGANTLRSLPGIRLEWQATDVYRIEAFVDDRFLRSGAIGFRELGFQPEKVYGVNLLRDWTY